jgi:hypothetical protein
MQRAVVMAAGGCSISSCFEELARALGDDPRSQQVPLVVAEAPDLKESREVRTYERATKIVGLICYGGALWCGWHAGPWTFAAIIGLATATLLFFLANSEGGS